MSNATPKQAELAAFLGRCVGEQRCAYLPEHNRQAGPACDFQVGSGVSVCGLLTSHGHSNRHKQGCGPAEVAQAHVLHAARRFGELLRASVCVARARASTSPGEGGGQGGQLPAIPGPYRPSRCHNHASGSRGHDFWFATWPRT